MIKKIFLDLDRTTTNSDKIVTAETKEAIKNTQSKGYQVSLCTGRQLPLLLPLINLEELFAPTQTHIIAGGAEIMTNNCQPLWKKQIEAEVVAEIFNQAKVQRVSLTTSGQDKVVVNQLPIFELFAADFKNDDLLLVEDYQEAVNIIVASDLKQKFIDFINQLEQKKFLSSKKMLNYQGQIFLDLTAYGVNKGLAIREWSKINGIPLSEIAMVGDGENDLPALQIVGYPLIMGNAVVELKNQGFRQLDHTDNDGLAKWLNELPII